MRRWIIMGPGIGRLLVYGRQDGTPILVCHVWLADW